MCTHFRTLGFKGFGVQDLGFAGLGLQDFGFRGSSCRVHGLGDEGSVFIRPRLCTSGTSSTVTQTPD